MVTIIFESHATSVDNEAHLASGHFDAELSELGKTQAKELGQRYAQKRPAAVFCSDLQRSFHTGELAFSSQGVKVYQDKRLRECDYGELTRHPSAEVESRKAEFVSQPFPQGESYEQTTAHMKEFLAELMKNYQNKTVMQETTITGNN